MSQEDPFGLHGTGDRTVVIRPQPGGRPPLAMPATSAPIVPRPNGELTHPSRNPLIAAGAALLSLAPQLRRPEPPTSPEALRQAVLMEVQRFVTRATNAGAAHDAANLGAWALCALLDDVVLNTPWGRHSRWPSQTLAGTLYHEVDVGERFFERLAELERNPGRHRDLLELMYVCLAMGFEGRYRLPQRTGIGLAEAKEGLHHLLRAQAPSPEPDLAPHWQGVAAAVDPRPRLPLWVLGVATLLLILALYTGFSFRLANYTDRLGSLIQTLPPARPVVLVRPDGTPSPAAARLPLALLPKFERLLEVEIREGFIAADETPTALIIRLRNRGLFAPGSAEVALPYLPIVDRLARALEQEAGQIRVIGHTDSTPIRRTPRFPSNWELSKARAEAVAALIAPGLSDQTRLAVDGRADTEPLMPNDTEAGRSANRRVEILLLKTGWQP